MSKYDKAIIALTQRMTEIGGELYTIELTKKAKNGEAMAALFGGLMDVENKQAELHEIIEAIKYLQAADDDNSTTEVKI